MSYHSTWCKILSPEKCMISLSFLLFFWCVFNPFPYVDLMSCSLSVSYQRSSESPAAASPRSDSPADFFSQMPKEKPSFQIPVSAGDPPCTH